MKACDVIRLLLNQNGEDSVPGEAEVVSALEPFLGPSKLVAAKNITEAAAVKAGFHIAFKPNRKFFFSGVDPVTLFDEIKELGQAHITAHAENVPPFASLEVEHCYLWWEILLVTLSDVARVREVFAFVEGECELEIRLLADQAGAIALLGSIPSETLDLFRSDCQDQLQLVESATLALDEHRQPAGKELDALFRGIHSIKGNAGVLLSQIKGGDLAGTHPLRLLHALSHALESLLDPCRAPSAGAIPEQTIQTTLDACDAIQNLLNKVANPAAPPAALPHDVFQTLKIEIAAAQTTAPTASTAPRSKAFFNTTSQWIDVIRDCFSRLNTDEAPAPILETYLRGVKTLSSVAHYQNLTELEPPLARQLQILDEAVRDGGKLEQEQRSSLNHAFESLCALLKQTGQKEETGLAPSPPNALPAESKARAETPAASSSGTTIRIEQDKLDRLMRITGELLVARGAFPILVQKLNNGVEVNVVAKELKDAGSTISRISDDLQASIMSIRMLPAKTVFQKFPRMVRDLARGLGKEVRLVVEGERTELDKTILEQIGDPLIHVIRNAVDHGLETPEKRQAAGKDPCGVLKVRAGNEAGGVIIEISDDGQGLDASALKRKAIQRGLMTADAAAAMSDEAAFQLIFMPGLSTAEKVTAVSGRGVGMDVVRSNVRNLQGTIDIRSKVGQGTTFSIKLPTSLMVSKGILLEAGSQEYILPLANIRDMVKIPSGEVHEYQGMKIAQVRGNTFPLFSLAETLGLEHLSKPETCIALLEVGNLKFGLIVDKFVSEVEVLVKPLTGGLDRCREFQGASIMGDGRVVLVLNPMECHRLRKAQAAG